MGTWKSKLPVKRSISFLQLLHDPRNASTLMAVLVGAGLFLAGYALGSTHPTRSAYAQSGTPEDLESLFAPFWETWNLLHDDFVDQPLDDEALMQGAIDGMVAALQDPHTDYMTPEQYGLLNSDLSGQFEGIGAEVEQDEDGDYVILSVLEGSPAQAAGLLPDDQIVAVDGTDVRGLDDLDVITRVRGPSGSQVGLTIRRPGTPGTLDLTVTRAVIVIQDVEWRMVDEDIAYVRLNQFSQTASTNLHSALEQVLALQPRALILDVRGNSGGLLDIAIDITGEFIPDGTVMIERWGDGRERIYQAQGDGLATAIPLVLLVDEGSASASELLAAAIRDRERGTIVGETTFGKGTVQNWQQLSDGSGLRVTIARWFSPDGDSVQESGLHPDVFVEASGPRPSQPESDVQLNAAIGVLRGQSLWPTWPLPWLDSLGPGFTG